MARRRQFVQRPKARALAEFIVRITQRRSTQWVHELMGRPSRATWATYMNGSVIIPRTTLGALVKAVSAADGHALAARLREADRLWKAADEESRRPEGDAGESALVHLHERLARAAEGRYRAELAAARANATVGTLRDMGALLGVVIDSTRAQLRMATDRERAGLQRRLAEARVREDRIVRELARAQSRRYTAEQARQALSTEMIAAREEIARLRQDIARIPEPDLPDPSPTPPVALLPAPEVVMEVLDERLDAIIGERPGADEEVADLVELAGLEPDAAMAAAPPDIEGEVVQPAPPGSAPPTGGRARLSSVVLDDGRAGTPSRRRPAVRAVCLALVAALGVSLAWDPAPAGPSAPDPLSRRDGSPLTIGVTIDAPGLGALSQGASRGFETSMSTWLATRLGFGSGGPRFMALTPGERLTALREGRVDVVIAHVEITETRKHEVDFVGPYLRSYHGVLVRKGDRGVSSFKDLDGRTVCTRQGSTSQLALLNENGALIETRAGLAECVASLRRHEVDAVLDSQVDLYGYTENHDDIEVPPAVTDGQDAGFYAIALAKGTPVESCRRVYRALQEYVRTRWAADFHSNLGDAVKAFPTTWNAFAPAEGDMNRSSSCPVP
ncbi:transporter substrate-binding domain-containing protein [Streptomyces sp. NPDC058157]|uniref:transporter substrate-binding domain-containing protein n=1 Tax=Streptomyces sp. NPDC058157 TaxID=3346360 RepID=UPI0036F0ACF2